MYRDRRNIPNNYAPGLLHGTLENTGQIQSEEDIILGLIHKGLTFRFWQTGARTAQDLDWLAKNHERLYSYAYTGVRLSTHSAPSQQNAIAHIVWFGDEKQWRNDARIRQFLGRK